MKYDRSDTGDKSSIITNSSKDNGEGVIVGSEKTDAKGILVLESTDKAIVLPRIDMLSMILFLLIQNNCLF